MLDDDKFRLDREHLIVRGWTREKFDRSLLEPYRWKSVNHWQNHTGKAAYFEEKVMQAE